MGNFTKRADTSHKGSFGSALFIGGSMRYTGAALLAGKACSGAGVGYLGMAISSALHPALAGQLGDMAITSRTRWRHRVNCNDNRLAPVLANKQAISIGPGLSLSPNTQNFAIKFLENILPKFPNIPVILTRICSPS